MSDDIRPKWYGTRRGARKPKTAALVHYKKQKPVQPGDDRQPNGLFIKGCAGGPGAPKGHPSYVKPSMETQIERARTEIRRTVRQIIASDFPNAMSRSVEILVEIMEDKEQPAAARIAAVRELQNRHDGKAKEHRTVKRVGTTDTNINVLLGSDLAWMDEIKDPEARIILAARIHRQQLAELEHTTIDVSSVEIPNGQADDSEVQARPQPDDGGTGPHSGPVPASGVEIDV